MSYTQAEKLQILMLTEIFRKLNIENSFNPDIIDIAVTTDNTWILEWDYYALKTENDTPPDVIWVADVLTMYNELLFSYKNLNPGEIKELEDQLEHFHGEKTFTFPGFDGNNEGRFMTIADLFKRSHRFTNMDITKNSHMPTKEIYSRMLKVYNEERNQFIDGKGFSIQSLVNIIKARIHPDNRK
ncbi:YfbU family protein [Serratia fonticola]|uniref:YfbU family protein n=1 Tax=Serratia fonticola TaxID=47917 RepID=UPI0015C60ED1|nr:YfbU family protein [Serratia fonticola]MBC3378482.1 YfbU family protein [Serratia fonticola]NYA37682.1 YfbU family protein [Serratia fonticola]